jgi:exodeoxyribonuclease-3
MLSIYSWNVNGIRAVTKKGTLLQLLDSAKPDIVCLQEIKAKPEQIDLPLNNYQAIWYSAAKPGYSGVALLSKTKPLNWLNGFSEKIIKQFGLADDGYGDPNQEGRVLSAEFSDFWLVNVYTPNAKDDLSRLALRHQNWDPAFLAHLNELQTTKPVITCGDFNVAHSEDDLANPKSNKGKKGFTDEERSGFQALIDAGYIDSFRLFHQGNGFYTWWSHFANARTRNVGWRIDYFLISSSLRSKVTAADIHPQVTGSDHCPISLSLDL